MQLRNYIYPANHVVTIGLNLFTTENLLYTTFQCTNDTESFNNNIAKVNHYVFFPAAGEFWIRSKLGR